MPESATRQPKVFISYSWSSARHIDQVISWAKRLASDGVEVVMDKFDLREGHDKNAFMERMVTDATVTHVLVFTDKAYVEKANARKAGVGTESQIISQEIYSKVEQSKFIPIFCELSEAGEPLLPVFLKSRIGIDFSNDEAVNRNWEQLIRLLYGKPLYEKPKPGSPPAYITAEQAQPVGPFVGKLNVLRQAIVHGQRNLKPYRNDFLEAALSEADSLRIRTQPRDLKKLPEEIVETFRRLVPVRNAIIDWVLLEAEANTEGFNDVLSALLERLIEIKSRPKELNAFNDAWFGAHVVFVYETFLYVVASLLRAENYTALNSVLFGHYLVPEHIRSGRDEFVGFHGFYGYTEVINRVLDEKLNYYSQAVELIKRHADRRDLPFSAVIEADALCVLASRLRGSREWYPQTFCYLGYGSSPAFFVRLAQHRYFEKLTKITRMDAATLKAKAKNLLENRESNQFERFDVSVNQVLNLEKWDTLQ